MPEPISSNILEDFQAPPDAVKPFQSQLQRIRQGFAMVDTKWLGIKLVVFKDIELTDVEKLRVSEVDNALRELNNSITNRSAEDRPDQAPAKNTQVTY